jgi:hypothetical protein
MQGWIQRNAFSLSEVPLGAGVLRLLVPAMVVGKIINRRCAADRVKGMR